MLPLFEFDSLVGLEIEQFGFFDSWFYLNPFAFKDEELSLKERFLFAGEMELLLLRVLLGELWVEKIKFWLIMADWMSLKLFKLLSLLFVVSFKLLYSYWDFVFYENFFI